MRLALIHASKDTTGRKRSDVAPLPSFSDTTSVDGAAGIWPASLRIRMLPAVLHRFIVTYWMWLTERERSARRATATAETWRRP